MSDEVNKRFSVAIIPYTFVGAGEKVYGRLLPLYLVVGLKLLQVSVANWEEELGVKWWRARINWCTLLRSP